MSIADGKTILFDNYIPHKTNPATPLGLAFIACGVMVQPIKHSLKYTKKTTI